MKYIVLVGLFLFCAFSIKGQNYNKLSKTFSSNDNFVNRGAIVTSDGGSIAVGGFYSGSANNDQTQVVVKYNAIGDTLWTKQLAYDTTAYFHDVEEAANGDVVIVGSIYNGQDQVGGYASLVRLDATGNLIWSKKIGYINGAIFNLQHSQKPKLEMIGDDAIVYNSVMREGNFIYLNISRVDINGNEVWSNDIEFDALFTGNFSDDANGNQSVGALTILNNGNIFIFGSLAGIQSGNYMKYLFATIIDATNGIPINSKVTDILTPNPTGIPYFRAEDAMELANGNIIVSGYAYDLAGLTFGGATTITLDASLNFINGNVYNTSYADRWLINENPDGSQYAFGATTGGPRYAFLTKTDANGVPIWTKRYSAECNGTAGMEVKSANEIYLSFTTKWLTSAYRSKAQNIVTDSSGITVGCFNESANLPMDNFTQTWVNFTPVVGPGFTVQNVVFTASSFQVEILDVFVDYTANIINPSCNGDLGTVDITPNVTNGPYTFAWSNGTVGEDLIDYSGSYTMLIKDAYGCEMIGVFDLVEPNQLNAVFTVTDVDCFGSANGGIDVTVSGGTPGYSYSWSNNDTTQDLAGLGGGFYQLTISDTNGCASILGVGVNEPTPLIAVISNIEDVSCHGYCDGQIVGFGAGGSGGYSYLWNDVNGTTNDTVSNLCYGNFLFTVTDTNGCVSYTNAVVNEPLLLTNTTTTWPSDCFSANGSALANPLGGTAPYTFIWDGGTPTFNDSVGGFDVGSYSLVISDPNGCNYSESFTIASNTTPTQICVVTVDSNNQNLIVWEKPIATNIAGYNIYRNIAGVYTQVGYQPYDSLSQYVDNDFGVDPQVTSYRYKISVLDSCGNESAQSDFHETIHLTTSVGVGGEVNLIWDDYEGFPYSSYNILLDSTETGNYFVLANVPNTNFTYIDFNPPSDSADYIIEVVMPATCSSTQKANHNTTRSNKGNSNSIPASDEFNNAVLNHSTIYPNPSSEKLTIELKGSKDWSYKVFNMTGELIEEVEEINTAIKTVTIDKWPNGIYLFQLQIQDQFINHKIIKH
jgi:hypothetical protein